MPSRYSSVSGFGSRGFVSGGVGVSATTGRPPRVIVTISPGQRLVDETGELFLSLIERIGAHGGLQCLAPSIRGGESADKRGAPLTGFLAARPHAPRKLLPPSSRPRGAPWAPPQFSGCDRP
jgi:hypothetical protein